jgi:hypothetical protein
MTETRDAPTAYLISTLKTRVSRGTRTTPPPRPVSAPRNPAMNEPRPTRMVNSRLFNPALPSPVCHSWHPQVGGTAESISLPLYYLEACSPDSLLSLNGRAPSTMNPILMNHWESQFERADCRLRERPADADHTPFSESLTNGQREDLLLPALPACNAYNRCW